ncbi:MAG: hypothetical protein U1F60_06270 [Planctomycetota bacterium]
MKEDFATAVLRIIAIVIATIGTALVLVTIVYMWGIGSVVGSRMGSVEVCSTLDKVGWCYLLAHASIVGLGGLLFRLRPFLARHVVA